MLDLGKVYDVIVCGAGHAGCEAALAAARMGAQVLLLTGNVDTVAQMSCNPAIGGLAKGHIVREIDALGGEMAVNADATGIQFRVLNMSKGPAVQSPRAQCDKKAYQFRMKAVLERTRNLTLFQAEVLRLVVKEGRIRGVDTNLGVSFLGKTVVLTTGTFLKGLLHVGAAQTAGGRMGDFASNELSGSLTANGIRLERLKTGTPARILGESIDFSKCQIQRGDKNPRLFAFYDTREADFSPQCASSGGLSGSARAEESAPLPRPGAPLPGKGDFGRGGERVPCDLSDGRLCEIYPDIPESPSRRRKVLEARREDLLKMFHVEQSLSFGSFEGFGRNQLCCYETDTTALTKEIILANLERSAMYGGYIKGIGPRYCPSIEDKMVRFASHATHRLFLEPEGRYTGEWYINGLSTSMPLDVQLEIIRSVVGLEHAEVERPAYAVEYDYAPPTQLYATLESKVIEGLFCAGQINGTSGYEEAAGQGLIAGANAAAKVFGRNPIVLKRHESYIGVLIDDLVTKGTKEPYRMFTSRAEYRLLLNHSSAEMRLFEAASSLGLVSPARLSKIEKKIETVNEYVERFESGKESLMLRRDFNSALGALPIDFLCLPDSVREEILYRVVYRGYLERDMRQIEKAAAYENIQIPPAIDYSAIKGLRIEASQKLKAFAPMTVGQASRISGVSPADISVLIVHLKAFLQSK